MSSTPIRVSIVAPTYNEAHNVAELARRLSVVLDGMDWEVIFVDDNSPDGTAETVKALAATNPRVRCIRRVNRRGLSGACIEGVLSSSAPIVAVMDADLQHDESILPEMIGRIARGESDIVVGSRLVEGGSSEDGFTPARAFASNLAIRMAGLLVGSAVSDLTSGFFAIRRDVFEAMAPRLTTSGFKILLDVLATASPPLRASAVGGSGVVVHLAALRFGMNVEHLSFSWAQGVATVVAMTWNFIINNVLTYSDAKLRGWRALTGLLQFYAVCGVGAVANVGIAKWLFDLDNAWWLAALAGILMGSVWNYAMSSLLVWRRAD